MSVSPFLLLGNAIREARELGKGVSLHVTDTEWGQGGLMGTWRTTTGVQVTSTKHVVCALPWEGTSQCHPSAHSLSNRQARLWT